MKSDQNKLTSIVSQLYDEARVRDEMESLPTYPILVDYLDKHTVSKDDLSTLDLKSKFILFYFLKNELFDLDDVVAMYQSAMEDLPCEWFGSPDYLEKTYSIKMKNYLSNYFANKMFEKINTKGSEMNCIEGENNAYLSSNNWNTKDYFMGYILGALNIDFDFRADEKIRNENYAKLMESMK